MSVFSQVRDREGAAAVEFLIVGPIFILFAFACLQFAAIFFAYLSVLSTARDVTRWITVSPNTVDSVAISSLQARLPSDIDPTRLTVGISPACTALIQNRCPNRAAGQDIAVTLTYDISGLYFMPTTYTLGLMTVQLPTQLHPYTMHMQAEPS